MRTGGDQEMVLHLHRFRGGRRSQTSNTPERPENLRRRKTQLHIGKMHAQANARAGTERVEDPFCLVGHFVVEPSGGKEPGGVIIISGERVR